MPSMLASSARTFDNLVQLQHLRRDLVGRFRRHTRR